MSQHAVALLERVRVPSRATRAQGVLSALVAMLGCAVAAAAAAAHSLCVCAFVCCV